MAEYLSPGVYVEEFDSGIKAMEGVGTSTAGFIGFAQKGPIKGLPVLITSMADYQRRFGGYLPERDYDYMRFLPNAVEQFFNNGGSTCYVMRVCAFKEGGNVQDGPKPKPVKGDENQDEPKTDPGEGGNDQDQGTDQDGGSDDCAAIAQSKVNGSKDMPEIVCFKAANPGAWGNNIQAEFTLNLKSRIQVEITDGGYKADGSSFQKGDLIYIQDADKTKAAFGVIKTISGGIITLEWDAKVTNADTAKTNLYIALAEWNLMLEDDTLSEQYENVSFNPARNNFVKHAVAKSQLVSDEVTVQNLEQKIVEGLGKDSTLVTSFSMSFEGGSDGKIEFSPSLYLGVDGAPDERTGLMAFKTLSDVSIMAIPGITDQSVQSALVNHCESLGSRVAILDMPFDAKEVSELQAFRENVDSSYAAMYHPWLQCYDPLADRKVFLPPSGSIAGIYARTDNSRGVHKAPANEVVSTCTDLSVRYNEAEQGKLNPKGINLIRAIQGQGIRVWGARSCSSDGNWKYINVRRLFIFIEESIKANTNWAVFEPNDEMLWSRLEGTIRVFLTTQWRNGALAGSTADEAFFINIGKSTMTEDDILNGRLICVIGIAPVRPAEFVIFRITQKMESAQ